MLFSQTRVRFRHLRCAPLGANGFHQ